MTTSAAHLTMATRRAGTPSRYSDVELGSPDPLAEDFIASSTAVAHKQIEVASPKLSSEQGLSPWRVKVTIEAEPDDGNPSSLTSMATRKVRRTMLVPLNDISTSERPARPTKGSRKSNRQSASPARRRRQSVTDLDVVVLGDDGEENEWTAKPTSPRKRRNSTKKTRKSGSTVADFEVREDARTHTPEAVNMEVRSRSRSPAEMRDIDLNTLQAKARSDTKKQVEIWSQAHRAQNIRTFSMNSAMSYPTPSPEASEQGDLDNRDQDEQDHTRAGLDTMMESEGFTMIDLDTLPSMKHIRNTPDYPTIPEVIQEETRDGVPPDSNQVDNQEAEQPSISITADESELTTELNSSPPDGATKTRSKPYSIAHLQLPSSTNVQRYRLVTPMPRDTDPYSSPKLPTPPAAPAPIVAERSPIHSDQAVEATNILQHAVTPEKEKKLFGGFSGDTRRELRAELRFGEELGRRQDSDASNREIEHVSTQLRDADSDGDDQDDGTTVNETTIGDIWLAEANKVSSSSPEPQQDEHVIAGSAPLPRRKLIPSPWKRGQQMDQSNFSADESVSGLFWLQQTKTPRFGEAFVGDEEPAVKPKPSSNRRRSGMYDAEKMVVNMPRRVAERRGSEDDQDLEDENFDAARNDLEWRNAADVVDEETNELEHVDEDSVIEEEVVHPAEVGHTKLYETNLDNVPDQDLSSPSQDRKQTQQHSDANEHDSTYSSISEDSPELYRQRISISPSKERPNTPRSALKGGRASFGQVLRYGDEQANGRKVVWARKSSCMNEHWEESTTSIRSNQSLPDDDTPTPRPGLNLEASFEVNPQPPSETQTANNGWFGWFNKNEKHEDIQAQRVQTAGVSCSSPTTQDEASHESAFEATSRHALVKAPSRTTPSYLLPPSYPSDPTRDISVPLTTCGDFTNTHFRTLHIIYRKSQRPRFRAPNFPKEIRPALLDIVGKDNWKLDIDESATMGEDGLFEFSIGAVEAQVLERFMREVEHGYGNERVNWGWSVERLAEYLGRLAVGERIREEEKEAQRIMGGVKGLKV